PARRPLYSALELGGWQRWGLAPLPAWQDGLGRALG
ncbi:NAD(P)-dependent oxidoreductase, partial [Corynebacterium heidelbergense]